jgi:hypothetical protein
MKVQAKQKEFNIYNLFLHDNGEAEVTPFDQWSLAKKLNELAQGITSWSMFIDFVSPRDSDSSQWQIRFNKSAYDTGEDGRMRCKVYPTTRVYDERSFRRNIPVELDEVLMELDKVDIVL